MCKGHDPSESGRTGNVKKSVAVMRVKLDNTKGGKVKSLLLETRIGHVSYKWRVMELHECLVKKCIRCKA